jgi:hypothetical protein
MAGTVMGMSGTIMAADTVVGTVMAVVTITATMAADGITAIIITDTTMMAEHGFRLQR